MTETREIRLKRLRYQSRYRGTQELDLLIGGFADRRLARLTDAQLDRFERLLMADEPRLFDWITGRAPVPPEFDNDVMALLRAFKLVETPP
jgi:antitoxin CptB